MTDVYGLQTELRRLRWTLAYMASWRLNADHVKAVEHADLVCTAAEART
jgi:hypothetical protein